MAMPERTDAPTRPLYVAEPASRYAQRAPAVVDASLIAALLFAEAGQHDARERLVRCQPVAPDLLPYELANVAVNKLRRGHAEDAVRASLADLPALGIELHPIDASAALDIAARHGLTAYDAAYLALAEHLCCPLYTFDRQLAEAARRHLGPPE
jgi:predicted nucleic acid-binding protein